MKYLVNICRFLVGIAFILSGLIKLNDPLGLAYKLEEYFSEDVLNLPVFEPFVLELALFVVIFEVALGVFLLIGFKPKWTVIGLIGMIVFFTFLTFYSAYFDKVKDCGCFGDLIKLSPWGSFIKDLIFLAFLLPIFFGIKHVKPLFKPKAQWFLALLSIVLCAWLGYYVLNHLPVKDFRAYKIGANIPEGMIIPEDAPKPIIDYHWNFMVNGKEQVITTNGSYPTIDGEFISVETETIDEGYEPPIFDFSIESDSDDLTDYYLSQENVVVIVSYSLEKMKAKAAKELKPFVDEAKSKGYKVIGLTASGTSAKDYINTNYSLGLDFYLCDEKALKTVVRSNPGIVELNKGTVMQKVHWNDIEDFVLTQKTQKKPEDSNVIRVNENKILYRINGKNATKQEADSLNPQLIESVSIVKDSIEKAKITNEDYEAIMLIELKDQTP